MRNLFDDEADSNACPLCGAPHTNCPGELRARDLPHLIGEDLLRNREHYQRTGEPVTLPVESRTPQIETKSHPTEEGNNPQ